MKILGNRVLVSRIEEEKKEGFTTVAVQDDFIYRGRIEEVSHVAAYVTHEQAVMDLKKGDIIIFAKYSPDTHEVDIDGKKYKSVAIPDILAVL